MVGVVIAVTVDGTLRASVGRGSGRACRESAATKSQILIFTIMVSAILPSCVQAPGRAYAGAGSVIRLIVPVVLWPCCSSTSSTSPPQLCTRSAPTTWSML